jgi:tetratricopeptide (TPR) repeat protein
MRYAAFISYNHRDRRTAAWLHRALETYRFPKRLQGRPTAIGALGAKLPPIFQDREELAASSDLAASVREALEQAHFLIVICSPDGAQSHWVNEEIRSFTALGRRNRIQCLIVSGEPNASRAPGGDPAQECLPQALFEGGGSEPLASDIRPGQDSRTAARLKLLAGITGLPYDELRQREQLRRHRRLAVLAAVLSLALLATSALAAFALISRKQAIQQRDLARRKTLTAERTVEFVKSMFAVADPSEARGATITAREVVDRGAARVQRELTNEPSVRAELQTTLAEVYGNLGLLSRASALVEQSLRIPGLDPGSRARQYLALAEIRNWQADDVGAADAYSKALALARDPASGRSDLVPRILAGRGETLGYLDRPKEGEGEIQEALRIDRSRGAAGQVDVARDLEALGKVLTGTKDYARARSAYNEALAIRLRRQGETHPLAFQDLNELGSVAYLEGDNEAAERYFRQVLPLAEQVLGKKHTEYALALNNVARMEIERRAYGQAVPRLREAVAIQEAARGPRTEELVFPLLNLAVALRGIGKERAAEAPLRQARTIAVATKHPFLGMTMVELADVRCDLGNRASALQLLQDARRSMASASGTEPWQIAWLELVDAQCRKLAVPAHVRAAILARWKPVTHYGWRADHSRIAG